MSIQRLKKKFTHNTRSIVGKKKQKKPKIHIQYGQFKKPKTNLPPQYKQLK